jgi:hypothetical protein
MTDEVRALEDHEWTGGELAVLLVEVILLGALSPGTLAFLTFLTIIAYGAWFMMANN